MGRPPIHTAAMSGAERTRRYRLRRAPEPKPDKDAIIRDLETRVQALDTGKAALEARNRDLEAKLARMPKPAKAPQAPSDWADDPRTKGLQTQVQNLRTKVRVLVADFEAKLAQGIAKVAADVRTLRRARGAVMFALHPDHRPKDQPLPPDFAAVLDAALLAMNESQDGRRA